MQRKVINIQALRGVAAMMVLFAHLQGHSNQASLAQAPGASFWNIGHAGVDLFFIISGFVMATATAGTFTRSGEPWRFLQRRVLRIYPLYWLFTLIVLPIYLFWPQLIHSAVRAEHVSIWRALLLIPQSCAPLIAQAWTLIHEMYFYIIFAMLLNFQERYLSRALLLWAAVIAGVGATHNFGLQAVSTHPVEKLIFNPLTLEFITGCCIARLTHNRNVRGGIGLLIIGCALLVLNGPAIMDLHASWERVVRFGIPAGLVVIGVIGIEQQGLIAPRWMQYLGDASYSIYLIQGLVFAGIALMFHRLLPQIPSHGMVIMAVMLPCAILAGLCCFQFIEKYLISVTHTFNFRKIHSMRISRIRANIVQQSFEHPRPTQPKSK